MLKKLRQKKTDSEFSVFIRTASSKEKKRVYKSVITSATEDQAKVIESAERVGPRGFGISPLHC